MTRLLPALHEGHAPFHLHQAFSDALDAYQDWSIGRVEPQVYYDGHSVAISAVFGRMRTCTDLLPIRLLDDVAALAPGLAEATEPPTYADAACIMRALCVERLRLRRLAATTLRH
jgi:hypothetical protein